MNLRDKVNCISKFCGISFDHSNMIDERQHEILFNIELNEEVEIKNIMSGVDIIILTGEAGDGKSRMIRNIEKYLNSNEFEVIPDFSALTKKDREEVIKDIKSLLSGEIKVRKKIIAANIGIFTKTLLKVDVELLDNLSTNSKVKIINFEKRNLAQRFGQDDKMFESIIRKFVEYDTISCDCNLKNECPFKKNLDKLQDKNVIENIRVLCDTLYLIGEHITFRELLSLIAYMVTRGEDCVSIMEDSDSKDLSCYNIFELNDDVLFRKFSMLDPVKKSNDIDSEIYQMCKENNNPLTAYIAAKRRFFFEKQHEDPYKLLPVDYLSEFRKIIRYLHKKPYYTKARGNDSIFIDVKKGLIKLISPYETNLEISFYDTPNRISKETKTKFNIDINNIELIWNRYDFKFEPEELSNKVENNTFSLSYYSSAKVISLNINYTLFKYIISAKNGLYLDRNSEIVEEFGLADFFRKVLKHNSNAYGKMQVIFSEKDNNYIDFELIKYKEKIMFSDKNGIEKVMIKRI